jgi:CRISPR-associated exonuclease Cas4
MALKVLVIGILALLGALLLVAALRTRKAKGFAGGSTVSLDDLTLYSERLKLVGRPDRLVRQGEFVIPEEWKPRAKRVYPSHKLQLGAYLLLVEEHFGVRPPFGVVVLAEGRQVKVPNTDELRAEVLAIAEKIREHKRWLNEEIAVSQPVWKCRVCGQRGNCRQVRQ